MRKLTSKFAREHKINAKNGGKIVKEFAIEIRIGVKKTEWPSSDNSFGHQRSLPFYVALTRVQAQK